MEVNSNNQTFDAVGDDLMTGLGWTILSTNHLDLTVTCSILDAVNYVSLVDKRKWSNKNHYRYVNGLIRIILEFWTCLSTSIIWVRTIYKRQSVCNNTIWRTNLACSFTEYWGSSFMYQSMYNCTLIMAQQNRNTFRWNHVSIKTQSRQKQTLQLIYV